MIMCSKCGYSHEWEYNFLPNLRSRGDGSAYREREVRGKLKHEGPDGAFFDCLNCGEDVREDK
jgi:hypothetical protein